MAILRCKMCGGDMEINQDSTVCECQYCGSKQTIPVADNEKKITLYERANRLRFNCEFDKATTVYESIISEFHEEAEAYWGNLLCKYGIEYVDDPADGHKVPTCHRSSFESIMEDPDFDMVMENADAASRSVYREQAKQIEEIRKGIIEVSGKEEPYDIFICYKETAEDGQRTIDSVIAQDVYDALKEKGYRVFFSRISLEDKLGTEYEPYIFAALNSAKIMLAFGTSYDYYQAVWVKNEWSRYIKLMAKDKSKHLIPCYMNIDAYDIPKEFAHLQAQDMGKMGATQDLIRGIDKLMGRTEKVSDTKTQPMVQQVVTSGPNVDALLKRGYDSLEDGAFDEAKTFFNDALNINAQSAEAYLGLFMVEAQAKDQSAAQSMYVAGNFTENRYWKRAKQYASSVLSDTLSNWDSLRDAHLRKIVDAEEARKKKQEQVKRLQEKLRNGYFEMTSEEQTEQERLNMVAKSAMEAAQAAADTFAGSPEVQEVTRVGDLIASKKTQLAGLSFFKGKEKKELQIQIDALEDTLIKARQKVFMKQSEIDGLKQKAEYSAKQAAEYGNKVINAKRKPIREQMLRKLEEVLEVDFSGETVQLGFCRQGKGYKPIEWRVLERTDKGILLITRYAINCMPYHDTNMDITWEKCDLRRWLNREFLNVFDEFEESLIADTRCLADRNPDYNTDSGNATTDKIFLLSISEAERFFNSDEDRRVAPTAHAKELGAEIEDSFTTAAGENSCTWWLRSPGRDSDDAAFVNVDGMVMYSGNHVYINNVAVRPALWINLE